MALIKGNDLNNVLRGTSLADIIYGYGGADTIFLLSDGSPTKPDGTLDSTDKIILAVLTLIAIRLLLQATG